MTPQNNKQLTYSFPEMHPEQRLRELILYVAQKCTGDAKFGRTKLYKILYFADIAAYRQTGKPISGAEYVKLPYGPIPAVGSQLLETMEQEHIISIQDTPVIEFVQQRVIAHKEPNLDLFTAREIDILHDVIDELKGMSASEVSDLSHGIAWQTAEMLKAIPYEAALLSDAPIDEDDIAAAQELIRKYGWKV